MSNLLESLLSPSRRAQAVAADAVAGLKLGPTIDGNSTCTLPLGDGTALVGYTAAGMTVQIQGAWLGADQDLYVDAWDFAASVVAGWAKAIRAELERDYDDFRAAQSEGSDISGDR